MLLRVRIPSGGTVKLRIEPTLSYAQAIEQVAREAGLPPDGLSFSLNKRESLPALPAAAISSLGLTSGDLVYLIDASAPPPPAPAPAPAHTPTQAITALPSRPSPSWPPAPRAALAAAPVAPAPASAAAAIAQLGAMGFSEDRARSAFVRAGNNLERAIDLLTAGDRTTPTAPAPAAVAASSSSAGGSSLADAHGQALAAQPMPPVPTALVPQSWLSALDAAYANGGAANSGEAVIVLMHWQLTQAGFRLASTMAGPVAPSTSPPARCKAAKPASAALPIGWRGTPGLFTFGYAHERQPASTVLTVKCVPMGPMLLIHGMVEGGDGAASAAASQPAVLSAQITLSEYARHRDVNAPVPSAAALSGLPKLVHTLSKCLVQPSLDAIKLKLFDPNAEGAPTTLIDLLPELQFAVLSHLPPIELARCRSVCTSLLPLATDDLLWSRLYEQKYGEGPVGGASAGGGAAQAFRMRVKREKEAERERQRLRDRPPPNPYLEGPGSFGHHPGPPLFHDPFGGYGPGSMPGFIGGDFDRMPGGGGLPGFGGNPFGGMGPPGGGMGMGRSVSCRRPGAMRLRVQCRRAHALIRSLL